MAQLPDVLPQDTPLRRACLAEMTVEQVELAVETFRERRMAAYTAFQEAQRLKEEAKHEKDAALMKKRLEQLEKIFKSLDTNLDKAIKYCAEIKLISMTAGA